MKNSLIKLFLVSIIICRTAGLTCGQYIIAGVVPGNGYYFDINPDSVLTTNSLYPYNLTYSFDLDCNSNNNFRITNYYWTYGPNYRISIYIQGLNNSNQIACSPFPGSSNPNGNLLAHSFSFSDTIEKSNNWQWDTMVYLSVESLWSSGQSIPSHWIVGVNNSTYIGLRIIQSNDTLYGWLKIQINGTNSITLKEYACNQIFNKIDKNEYISNDFILSPNPNNGVLNIKTNNDNQSLIRIYNSLGYLCQTETVSGKNIRINLDNLSNGIYNLCLTDINGYKVCKKLIIYK